MTELFSSKCCKNPAWVTRAGSHFAYFCKVCFPSTAERDYILAKGYVKRLLEELRLPPREETWKAPSWVAALYVQENGAYCGLTNVDAWTESRDARRYSGPFPVVAHPPCQLWGAMANVNYARWGGEHNKPGNDGGCFSAALDSVRRFGGVLEHPAKSKAWEAHGLMKPVHAGWQKSIDGGYVCEVWQSAYGHRANKATWLYYHGANPPFELRWDRQKGTHQIGFHDQRGKAANKPTLGKREANATPLEFRDDLLRLARSALDLSEMR